MFQVEDALPDLGGREKKLFKGQDLCKYFCQYMFSFGLKVLMIFWKKKTNLSYFGNQLVEGNGTSKNQYNFCYNFRVQSAAFMASWLHGMV